MSFASVGGVLATALHAYALLMVIWAVASWIPQLRQHAALRWVGVLCEPALRPVRRLLPPTGGLDFSPLVVIVLLELLARWVQRF